ncbi:unnamed protein product [Mytilus coruscus]|uniref:Uncharacterized protein n=1 Tax=Mytilus coruscus TaxID=42192 RepID=A0A6J8F222_MYTCO|nr:unnamed protein product [Mytilus coruscus]
MTENKLRKYLRKSVSPERGVKFRTPVVLSDSKGIYLQNQSDSSAIDHIRWWVKRGAKSAERVAWLRDNIKEKIQHLGPIHIYIWLGTCDLTSITDNKGRISLTSSDNTTVENIVDQYREIVKILSSYTSSRVTFLSIPIYSISLWNQYKNHKDPATFNDQDIDLRHQIDKLNFEIKELNTSINSVTPNFNLDILHNPSRLTCRNTSSSPRFQYNLDLYRDGIHPDRLLSKVWLKKLKIQMRKDCWTRN